MLSPRYVRVREVDHHFFLYACDLSGPSGLSRVCVYHVKPQKVTAQHYVIIIPNSFSKGHGILSPV